MSRFNSTPTEVIVRILQLCEHFPQLFSLITACKHLHSVWISDPGTIIWAIGRRSIVAFDDALMAVRATEIVKAADQSKQRPPDPFPIANLSGTVRKPTPRELNAIFSLQHMMRCIEFMILHWGKEIWETHTSFGQMTSMGLLGEIHTQAAIDDTDNDFWRKNLYRALYRVILIGAVCSRAYNEPLVSAVENGDSQHAEALVTRGRKSRPVLEETSRYLKQFPVYNFDTDDKSEKGIWRDHEYEKIFGPLAEWLVNDGKARCVKEGLRQDFDKNDLASTSREIIHLVAAYEHLTTKIVNGDPSRDLGRPHVNNLGESYDWHDSDYSSVVAHNHHFLGGVRKATVVLLGVFQVEEITLPIRVTDIKARYPVANPCCEIQQGSSTALEQTANLVSTTSFWDIASFLPFPEPDCPAVLEFFKYTQRKYFNARFADNAFGTPLDQEPDTELEGPFYSLAWSHLFCNGESGNGLLHPYDVSQEWIYGQWTDNDSE